MPLLGKKLLLPQLPGSPLSGPDAEFPYQIEYSGEKFRSKDEYDKQVELYDRKIWTCRSTGRCNLTHREAFDSEQKCRKQVEATVDRAFFKPILEVVHHSEKTLDALVDETYSLLHRYLFVNEKIYFRPRFSQNTEAVIIKRHDNPDDKTKQQTSSPSNSDKENFNGDDSLENVEKFDLRRSGRSLKAKGPPTPTNKESAKLLPLKYDIRLSSEGKIITEVPVADIVRATSTPSKVILKPLIRTFALHLGVGVKAPWIVDQDLCHELAIPDKLPAEVITKAMELIRRESPKKRRHSENTDGPKPKMAKSSPEVCVVNSDDEEGLTLSEIKKHSPKLVNKSNKSTSKKKDDKSKTPTSAKGATRQLTLLEMAKKKSTSDKSPRKSSSKSESENTIPPLALKLQRALRDNSKDGIGKYLRLCATELSAKQRNRLPEPIRKMVMEKNERMEELKKLKKMTEEERKRYHEDKAKQKREEQKRKTEELNKRVEDTQLLHQPLPPPRSVSNGTLFGRAAMCVELMRCYQGVIERDPKSPVDAEGVLASLIMGSEKSDGGLCYRRIMAAMLSTLSQSIEYQELRDPALHASLSEFPVSEFSAAELSRLLLTCNTRDIPKMADDGEDNASVVSVESEASRHSMRDLPEEILSALEEKEIETLEPEQRLTMLESLCHRIISSQIGMDHVEERYEKTKALWHERIKYLKAKNDELRQEKEDKKKNADDANKENEKKAETSEGTDIRRFYGGTLPEGDDLASVVKRRRMEAEQRELRAKEEHKQREKDAEKQKMMRQTEVAERNYETGYQLSKMVTRLVPIGTDRNHNRYWFLPAAAAGLCVEHGWLGDLTSYNVPKEEVEPQPDDAESSGDDDADGDDNDDDDDDDDEEQADVDIMDDSPQESSIPAACQNEWFVYDTEQSLNDLLAALHPKGIRESELRKEIGKRMPEIVALIEKRAKEQKGEEKVNGEEGEEKEEEEEEEEEQQEDEEAEKEKSVTTLDAFRSELIDLEGRLRNGGLGGVTDPAEWLKQVNATTELEQMARILTDLHRCVLPKFLGGYFAEEGRAECWQQVVLACRTWARLHFLMGVMVHSVRWELSAENARCKVCRRKGDEELLLLCDECNEGFHTFCLRPALLEIPEGEWSCPRCRPTRARRKAANTHSYAEEEEENQGDSSDEGTVSYGDGSDEDEEESESEPEQPRRTLRPRSRASEIEVRNLRSKNSTSSRRGSAPRGSELAKAKKLCECLLQTLMTNENSKPFRHPVNKREHPGYYDTIDQPVHLAKIKEKWMTYAYEDPALMVSDLRLLFQNTHEYYQRGDAEFHNGEALEAVLVEQLAEQPIPGVVYRAVFDKHSRKLRR